MSLKLLIKMFTFYIFYCNHNNIIYCSIILIHDQLIIINYLYVNIIKVFISFINCIHSCCLLYQQTKEITKYCILNLNYKDIWKCINGIITFL